MRETRDGLFFKKTPTEQLEAESQVDAPEATVPISSEEETVAEVQQEVAEEQKIEPTTGSSPKLLEFCISVSAVVSDAKKKSLSEQDDKPKLIELFRARKNSKSSWRRFISEGSRMLSNELGEIGGAGHFFGNDSGDARGSMKEKELKKVLRLLSLGEKRINLKEREFRTFLSEKKQRKTQKKFRWYNNWNVAEAGWTIQFQTIWENGGGDGKYFHLWLEEKGKN
jgi:hypothetical protein